MIYVTVISEFPRKAAPRGLTTATIRFNFQSRV